MFAGEVDLNTWYKPNIDKKVLKEFSNRSDIKGLFDILLFIFAYLFQVIFALFLGVLGGVFQLYYFMVIFFIVRLLACNMKQIMKHILNQDG